MARIRSVKPEFFTDEDLGCISRDARLLFIGLWCHSDKDGIIEYRPQKLRVLIFPYDEDITVSGFEALCQILENPRIPHRPEKRFIEIYEQSGERYIQVPKLGKHQKFHKDEKPKGYPKPNPASRVPAWCQQGADDKPLNNQESRPAGCQQGAGRPVSGNLLTETETEGPPSSELDDPSGLVTDRAKSKLHDYAWTHLLEVCRAVAPEMLREGLEDGSARVAFDEHVLSEQQGPIVIALRNYAAKQRAEVPVPAPQYWKTLTNFLRRSRDCPAGFWRNYERVQPLGATSVVDDSWKTEDDQGRQAASDALARGVKAPQLDV